MAITLSRLFANSEAQYNILLIAGKNGMKNLVRWVHMVEDVEVPKFLHGNEIVFTTGIAHRGVDWIVDFVKGLIKFGSVGLVLNIGPYINRIPQSVIDYCNKNDFPLFTVPWEVRLIDVTYDYSHKIIENEEHETTLASAFRNLIFFPEKVNDAILILERQGFYNSGDYGLMIIQGMRGETFLSNENWDELRFFLQSVLNSIEKPICLFVHNNSVIYIIKDSNNEELCEYAKRISEKIKETYPEINLYIGLSDVQKGYMDLQASFNQASTAIKTAIIQKINILNYKDTGIYKIIYAIKDIIILKKYVEETIGEIKKYDETNKTNFLETLVCYLDNNGSIQKISQIMNVHRNTINYKMRFIRTYFNISLDYKDIEKLLLAINIKKIIEK